MTGESKEYLDILDINEINLQKEEVEDVKFFKINQLVEIYNNGNFANDFHNDEVIEIIKRSRENKRVMYY